MYVDQEEISKWKSLYTTGDKTKIAKEYLSNHKRGSLNAIQGQLSTLFKHGFCNDPLYDVVKAYYDKIESQLKKVK